MLKIAIVGCGKIADSHVQQIQRIAGVEIVGVCDTEPLMARQLYERFPIKGYFTTIADLLDRTRPDVVHITTPPHSHYALAKRSLEAGCHVYVEKPFTVRYGEAQELVALAEAKSLKLTVGHDDQFSHVARRLRALAADGYLGGPPVHMESYYCYDFGDPSYARALLGDRQHWVRRLPGKLLQNIISHGIARIAEFLTTDSPAVLAHGSVSPFLQRLHEEEIVDELRVIISEAGRTTAYFTFSSQMRPGIRQFRVYGPKNGLVLDQDHETLLRLRGGRLKSYAEKFVPPVAFAGQHLADVLRNASLFLRRDFHFQAGMKYLMEAFYRSIVSGTPAPIPYREILRTAWIMDTIFEQLEERRADAAPLSATQRP
jgi:predicted dehydrogenase